jgi:hypothetical protein
MPRWHGVRTADLVLAPLDGSEPFRYQTEEQGRRHSSLEIHAPPGEYEAHLEELRRPEPAQPLTEHSVVTLDAERTTELRLPPPPAERDIGAPASRTRPSQASRASHFGSDSKSENVKI